MIERVNISNLKAMVAGTIELPRVVLFVGENGTGKTTVIQAIKLAIKGCLPEANIGSTADIFKLARSDDLVNNMFTGLTLDSGFSFIRTWERKSKRDPGTGEYSEKVSQKISLIPSNDERTLAEKEARIRAECGIDPTVVDVSEFLDMSDNKRRDFFYQIGGAGEVTWDTVNSILGRWLAANNNRPLEFGDLRVQIADKWGGSLESILNYLADEQRVVNREIKQARGAAEQMIKIKAQRNAVAGDLKTLKQELSGLREERDKLVSEISKSEALAMAIREREDRDQYFTHRLSGLQDYSALPDVEDLRGQSNYFETELDKLKNELAKKGNKLREKKEKAAENLKKAAENQRVAGEEYLTLETRENAFEFLKDIKKKLCEKCQLVFGELADLSKDIRKTEEKAIVAKGKVNSFQEAYEKASQASNLHELDSGTAISKAERKIEKLAYDIEAAEKKTSERDVELAKVKKELKEIQERKLEEPLPVDQAQKQFEGLITRMNELEKQAKAKQEEENELSIQLGSVADAEEAETKLWCIKETIKLLGPAGLKGELVKKTLEPIKSEVRESLKFFGYDRDFTFRTVDGRGNEIFDFGWKDNGYYVAFDSLSTGQQCILLACLVAVICKRSSSPLKLLCLDNLEVISRKFEVEFYNGLPQIAKFCGLDNLIAATSKSSSVVLREGVPVGLDLLNFPLETAKNI